MITLKRICLTATFVVSVLGVIAAAYASHAEQPTPPTLGIELALANKPFYVPAAISAAKVTSMFIRVPPADTGSDSVSAIRLDPKMENGKVKVTVYALTEAVDDLTTCPRWNSLKADKVGTYVAGLDQEVQLTKLLDYGVGVAGRPLTFRVVPKRVLSPLPTFDDPDPCECGTCGGLICCPYPGECLNCGSCGSVCCKKSEMLFE